MDRSDQPPARIGGRKKGQRDSAEKRFQRKHSALAQTVRLLPPGSLAHYIRAIHAGVIEPFVERLRSFPKMRHGMRTLSLTEQGRIIWVSTESAQAEASASMVAVPDEPPVGIPSIGAYQEMVQKLGKWLNRTPFGKDIGICLVADCGTQFLKHTASQKFCHTCNRRTHSRTIRRGKGQRASRELARVYERRGEERERTFRDRLDKQLKQHWKQNSKRCQPNCFCRNVDLATLFERRERLSNDPGFADRRSAEDLK